jgi:hypothetical protein
MRHDIGSLDRFNTIVIISTNNFVVILSHVKINTSDIKKTIIISFTSSIEVGTEE